MRIFFLILAGLTTALWGVTLYMVYASSDPIMHFYFGLISTIFCLGTHCWVFFYFIGTGQGIREGVLAHGLDRAAIKRTKRFKGMTFPFALFSMIFMIVASILGSGVRFGSVSGLTHIIVVYLGIAFNFFAFWQEHRTIKLNETLMAKLNSEIESAQQH